MKARSFIIMAAVLVGLAFMTNSCERYTSISVTITFTLFNGSGLETHMWIEGESIGGGNKLQNGGRRVVTKSFRFAKENPNDTETCSVFVGRNGSTLGYQEVTLVQTNTAVTAFYDGTYLTCSAK